MRAESDVLEALTAGLDAAPESYLRAVVAVTDQWWRSAGSAQNRLGSGLEFAGQKGLELKNVSAELSGVEGVIDVHDLHIWSLGSDSRALSCHVLIDDMPPSESDSILQRINDVLCARFQIRHTTVQFEHVKCVLAGTHCTTAIQEARQQEHRHLL